MFPNETRQRQERLAEQIFLLSEKILNVEEKEHLRVITKLQMIYDDGFKHSYSDFFPVLLKICEEENDYDLNYLSNNVETIRNTLEIDYSNGTKQYNDIYFQFTKLCDHLNLQIAEISVFTQTESKVNDATKIMKEATKSLDAAQKALEDANDKASSLQTELIAVLSIFAAIVLTFSGGLTLLGSVMTSINGAEHYECVVLVAIICGIIMFNTIFLMMYLVSKITERNIYARCQTADCDKCTVVKCGGLSRIRKRLPYVYYFNLLAIIGIVIDLIIWLLDIKKYI